MKTLTGAFLLVLLLSGCARCPETPQAQQQGVKALPNSAEPAIQKATGECTPANAREEKCQPRYVM
mgnify:CR=1 FL=1